MLYLGCHLSSSKGYAAMGRTALSIGANTFQFFTRNPRGGAAKSADPADAAVLVQMQQDGQLGRVVAHAPYTLNPCSKDERTREFAREVFESDLQRMELTPGNFYNFHPPNSGEPPDPQKPTMTLDSASRLTAASVMEVPLPSKRKAVLRSGMLKYFSTSVPSCVR